MPQISGGSSILSSSQIADGIIINDDIAAGAAITADKLSLSGALDVSDLTAATLVTTAEGLDSSNNDTSIPTVGAVISYITSHVVSNLIEASASQVSVKNTVTETNLMQVTIPANTLSTNQAVEAILFLNELDHRGAASRTNTIRIKYGTTTLATFIVDNTTQDGPFTGGGYVKITLISNGNTNAQRAVCEILFRKTDVLNFETAVSDIVADIDMSTSVEDSTGDLAITITAQPSVITTQQGVVSNGYIVKRLSV